VTTIEVSTAPLTVSVVEPLTEPEAAWIVEVPAPTAVAKPVPLIVATELFEELQATEFLRFCVLPSLYVPVAVNCCVAPLEMIGFVGVTTIDVSTAAAVTVKVVEPLTEPDAASIVELPAPTAVAKPAPLIVAADVFEELQATEFVRFCVEPSL
jgi:hypothetical protein